MNDARKSVLGRRSPFLLWLLLASVILPVLITLQLNTLMSVTTIATRDTVADPFNTLERETIDIQHHQFIKRNLTFLHMYVRASVLDHYSRRCSGKLTLPPLCVSSSPLIRRMSRLFLPYYLLYYFHTDPKREDRQLSRRPFRPTSLGATACFGITHSPFTVVPFPQSIALALM
jgi:hypothetical protein